MADNKTCPKCAEQMDQNEYLTFLPGALDTKYLERGSMSKSKGTETQAHVCPGCGFVELYATKRIKP